MTQHFHVTIHGGQAIVGSSGGQNAVGDGGVAQHSGSGDVQVGGPISQVDYKKALGDILAAVTAIREKLDGIHTDLFEYASDIVIKLRKLQLDGMTVPEVQAKVKEAFEDETVKAMVKEMKPDALRRGMDLLTTAANVANHPLAKAIVTGILAGLAAS